MSLWSLATAHIHLEYMVYDPIEFCQRPLLSQKYCLWNYRSMVTIHTILTHMDYDPAKFGQRTHSTSRTESMILWRHMEHCQHILISSRTWSVVIQNLVRVRAPPFQRTWSMLVWNTVSAHFYTRALDPIRFGQLLASLRESLWYYASWSAQTHIITHMVCDAMENGQDMSPFKLRVKTRLSATK